MIDFACKKFDLDDIIRCSLGITRAEKRIMDFFILNSDTEFNSIRVSEKTNLKLSTVQKSLKRLYDQGIILRSQKNLDNGGYVFVYRTNSKNKIREIIKNIIKNWSQKVEKEIDKL